MNSNPMVAGESKVRFRNSFRLLMNNFKSTYVVLLFRLIVLLITGTLAAVIITSNVQLLLESDEAATFASALEKVVETFFNSGSYAEFDEMFRVAVDSLVTSIGGILAFLNSHLAEVVFSCIGLVLLYLVNGFLNGLVMFAFGNTLHDKMSQYTETPFFVAFLRNVGTASLYQVVYVPLSFVYDVLVLAVCYLLFFRVFAFLSIFFVLFFSVTFIVVMQAIKLSVISDWMPAIIADGKKLGAAMKESFHMGKKKFAGNFSNYLVAIYFLLVVNVVSAAATFFSALFITLPASYIFLTCMQFTGYYASSGRKYFLSYTHIFDPNSPDGGVYIRITDQSAAPDESDVPDNGAAPEAEKEGQTGEEGNALPDGAPSDPSENA